MIRPIGYRSSVTDPLSQEIIPYIRSQIHPDAYIYLFGSRANQTNTVYSDRDIAIDHDPRLDRKKIAHIKEYFEETPYKIDIVDLSKKTYFTDKIRTSMIHI